MMDQATRREILFSYGASEDTIDELLQYTRNEFKQSATDEAPDDELFVDTWRAYADEARQTDAYTCLRRRLVQFAFPIIDGISKTDAYLAAIRQGAVGTDNPGLTLQSPDALEIRIHSSMAGSIPLIITYHRRDFVALVQALVRRNEPVRIPDSMGACMVSGYNNWDRVRAHKREWERTNPHGRWESEFQRFACRKELYQDRFIILSDGPYSGVSGREMGIPEQIWREASLIIRREHECAHYYTRRILGSMRNNLFDELIADFMGIVAVSGYFRADWFLRFMGLEECNACYRSGRFSNYTLGVSKRGTSVLHRLLCEAARNLEEMHGRTISLHPVSALKELTTTTLEELSVGTLRKG